MRIAAGQHDDQLVDIGFAPAEAGRQRQRHRPQAGIDRAEEAGGEFGAGLGDQREPVALFEAQRDEAAGMAPAHPRAARNRDRRGPGCRAHRGNSFRDCPWRHNRALRRASRNRRCAAPAGRASAYSRRASRVVSILSLRSSTRQNPVHWSMKPAHRPANPSWRGPFCLMVGECGTNMAMAATTASQTASATRRRKAGRIGAVLCRPVRDQPGKTADLSAAASCASAAGTATASRRSRTLADRLVAARLCRRPRLCAVQGAVADRAGYGERRVRQALTHGRHRRGGRGRRPRAGAKRKRLRPRFASRGGGRSGPFAAASPIPQQRERAIGRDDPAGHRLRPREGIIDLDPGENPGFRECLLTCVNYALCRFHDTTVPW